MQENMLANGWRQGSILNIQQPGLKDKYSRPLSIGSRCLVISQDCDLSRPVSLEPYVDVLEVSCRSNAEGNFLNGKSGRILHLDLGEECIECKAYEKTLLPKQSLFNEIPDRLAVSGNNLKILISWLNNRISRIAYPDEFHNRFHKALEKIKKIMKSNGEYIRALYVKLHPFEEIKSDQNYQLAILFLIDKNHYEDRDVMKKVDDNFERTINLLNDVAGIELLSLESFVRSSDDITVHELEQYYKLDLDHMSNAQKD